MGKMYYVTKDEKYATEWTFQYMDWVKKNPLVSVTKKEFELASTGEVRADTENARFAWRPLEVGTRLEDQTQQFMLFKNAASFTPEFLTEFLVNYHKHANHIFHNYSDAGNHLLFEAQQILYAAIFFPEYKDAVTWRKAESTYWYVKPGNKYMTMADSLSLTLFTTWHPLKYSAKLC